MEPIKIVGIGPGNQAYILPVAYAAIESADVLVGARRNLKIFESLNKEQMVYQGKLEPLKLRLEEQRKTKRIAVIVSGDAGFYSLLDAMKEYFPPSELEVIPGISSFQYLFARLKKSYKEYGLYSLHGRSQPIQDYLEQHQGIFLLTDHKNTPSQIAQSLGEKYASWWMSVGADLSYPNECIMSGQVKSFINKSFSKLCVVVIEKNET